MPVIEIAQLELGFKEDGFVQASTACLSSAPGITDGIRGFPIGFEPLLHLLERDGIAIACRLHQRVFPIHQARKL